MIRCPRKPADASRRRDIRSSALFSHWSSHMALMWRSVFGCKYTPGALHGP